jgi:E3 ubiquitin-protein ligase SIAH1
VPVHSIRYGEVLRVQVPSAPRTRLLLVAEDDGRAFLATVGALSAAAAAVSVVCVRASAAARPRFTCKMWVTLGPVADNNKVLVEMQVRSSTSPGAVVATDEPTFLPVLPRYLVPGDGPSSMSMEVPLSVRIDRVSPWSS